MSAAGSLLVAAPFAAVLSLTVALRPRGTDAIAPLRLAAVRAAVVTGAFAVLAVELLGALRLLTLPAFAVAWLIFLTAAAGAAVRRRRRDGASGTWPPPPAPASPGWPAGGVRRGGASGCWPARSAGWSWWSC